MRMRCLQLVSVLVLLVLAGCPGGDDTVANGDLPFEDYSPPIPGATEKPIAARGDVILTELHITRDGGQTWAKVNTQALGGVQSATVISDNEIVVHATACRLCRWDLDTDAVVDAQPPFANGFAFPATRTLFSSNTMMLARQPEGGTWSTVALPSPGGAPPALTMTDFAMNDTTMLVASTWGVYRSTDDGATFSLVFQPAMNQGAYLTVLGDGRFLLFDVYHTQAQLLDTTGSPTGSIIGGLRNQNDPLIGCMGVLLSGYQYSTDFGATWQPLANNATSGERAVCGGDYIVLRTGGLLVTTRTPGILEHPIGSWEGTAGPGAVLVSGDGSVVSGPLVWHPGDAQWGFHDGPTLAQFPLQDGTLVGFTSSEVLRSDITGATWTRRPSTGPPPHCDRFFLDGGQLRWASGQMGETIGGAFFYDAWLYRSDDDGATWSLVFMQTRTLDVHNVSMGIAPMLVGITQSGDFIADGYVSHDQGTTWTDLPNASIFALTRHDTMVSVVFHDTTTVNHVWNLYGASDPGTKLGTVRVVVDGAPVDAPTVMQFDDQDRVLVAHGNPVRVLRSVRPID